MSRAKGRSRGFTLVASLLVLALLSGIAISLLFMVQGAGQVGGNDLETNQAYYGAESGMELLTANLAALYQHSQSPTPAQITALTNNTPTSAMIAYMNYLESINWTPDANGNPASQTSIISSGQNAGLSAEIIPLTLKVVATRPGGASVNMTRGVEVALIPVFQFGVFSDSDLSYFAGPTFNFQGSVHTNGNLFLAARTTGRWFSMPRPPPWEKSSATGWPTTHSNGGDYTGRRVCAERRPGAAMTVADPTASPNCSEVHDSAGQLERRNSARRHSDQRGYLDEHVDQSFQIGFIGNGTSLGVQPLSSSPSCRERMAAAQQIAIIRKPPLGESRHRRRDRRASTTRPISASCWPALRPICIRTGPACCRRLDLTSTWKQLRRGLRRHGNGRGRDAALGTTRIAMAAIGQRTRVCRWEHPIPPGLARRRTALPGTLIDGWLRVEYQNAAGELGWGHAGVAEAGLCPRPRSYQPRRGRWVEPVHPNAILIFQELADRDANGNLTAADDSVGQNGRSTAIRSTAGIPINFYDPREGFPRDTIPAGMATQCYVNGIMNAVELDVGNFEDGCWAGPGGSGPR